MKILITTDFYLPYITGVTTVVVNEQRMLGQLGHEVRLLTIGDKRYGYYENGVYHMHACPIKILPDSYMTFSYNDPLVADILDWKPELVHSNNEFFSMGYARRIAGELHIPLLHTCHTNFTRYDQEQRIRHTLWDTTIARVVRRRVMPSDLVISPSQEHKQMLERYRIDKPVAVLPSGIDLTRFGNPMAGGERTALRKGLGFEDHHIVLVSVCRLSSEKRVNRTIDAFFLLSLLHSNVRLLIVGGGPKEEGLKRQAQELGLGNMVVFTGPIPCDQVDRYYKISDIFVSSSVRESQGLGFVEAMASGLPVLLAEDGSLGLSIDEEGCGFLYNDERGFVTVLNDLVDQKDRIKAMGEKAKATSIRFGLERWALNLSSLCEQLALDYRSKVDR